MKKEDKNYQEALGREKSINLGVVKVEVDSTGASDQHCTVEPSCGPAVGKDSSLLSPSSHRDSHVNRFDLIEV